MNIEISTRQILGNKIAHEFWTNNKEFSWPIVKVIKSQIIILK